jgi:hypothetical protein
MLRHDLTVARGQIACFHWTCRVNDAKMMSCFSEFCTCGYSKRHESQVHAKTSRVNVKM